MLGLRRKGSTPDGVPVYKSYVRFLSVNDARRMVVGSVIFAGLMLFTVIQLSGPKHHKQAILPCIYLGLWSSAFLLGGLGSLMARRRFSQLATRQQVCYRWNLTENDLATLLREHNIRPEINVNGYEYYNLADFGDLTSLLRASERPISGAETLVRPTLNDKNTDAPELLLRAGNGNEAT